MSSTIDFVNYVVDQISKSGSVTAKKMFGEYMVYVNLVPLLLVCDNTVYVKKINELEPLMKKANLGIPYPHAKEHYILDIDDSNISLQAIQILSQYRLKAESSKKNRK